GIRGVNEGVNAVAVRQCRDWSCLTDSRKCSIRTVRARGEEIGRSLGAVDKTLASSIGGAPATWDRSIEVIHVEVYASVISPHRCSWVRNMSKEATTSASRPA
ncbi:hypothetical protein EDB86DRAFT_2814402, partial [Lactarius hatsudake]